MDDRTSPPDHAGAEPRTPRRAVSTTDATPSGFLRLVLRADALATSRVGSLTLIPVLVVLVGTDTLVGYVVAGVLFAAVVAVGVTGRRHERRDDLVRRRREEAAG
ncbi:hypothetical protein [Streptomyces sp. NPDC056049]|uniref:hypothetical protein n=1 Tax=Streptomyces sp. NPDC056049 TaxID=3345693 RepID=UPI0035E2FA9F